MRTRWMITVTLLLSSSWAPLPLGWSQDSAAPTLVSPRGPTILEIAERHPNLTPQGLVKALPKSPEYLTSLSFDPTTVRYFDLAKKELELTDEEVEIFKRRGMVAIDNHRAYTFSTAYYEIYSSDLPVLITSDSILHAMHSSYDNLLSELESTWFSWTLEEVLAEMHLALEMQAEENTDAELAESYRDVDLYLTMARNLLAGANETSARNARRKTGEKRMIRSALGQDATVENLLGELKSLRMPNPNIDAPLKIYGGERYIDYSQFRPRGHYTDTAALRKYFRCMMWMGRADTGWNVLPTDKTPGVRSDDQRELRNAMLFTQLLRNTGNAPRIEWMDRLIGYLVGQHDSLNAFRLEAEAKEIGVEDVTQLLSREKIELLQDRIQLAESANQWIRSQIVLSNPNNLYKVPPPATFQAFGQRFAIDSYLLSHMVFDSIIYDEKKQRRMMPQGLDVMAGLGNSLATELLQPELKRWNYSANLLAGRQFIEQQPPEFWQSNLYSLWLDTLGELNRAETDSNNQHLPEVMKTRTWQAKQLQTQLASWSQLRHDTILYAKQSYTAFPSCEYPAGYVEPYPKFYGKVKAFADQAQRLIASTPYASPDGTRNMQLQKMHKRHLEFFARMSELIGRLETLARKELAGEPFTDDQEKFLGRTINERGYARFGSASIPKYNGWYSQLLYDPDTNAVDTKWEPTIADVHSDPESQEVLEVAVGNLNLCVVAIDNQGDRSVYVGPTFSYYEFQQPASERLTDKEWLMKLHKKEQPQRPQWTSSFAPKSRDRPKTGVAVTMQREGNNASVQVKRYSGKSIGQSFHNLELNDDGVATLARVASDMRGLNLARSQVTNEGIGRMSSFRELRNLDLSSTRVDGSRFDALSKSEWLRVLLLRNTLVSDEAAKWFSSFPRLEVLDLSGTRITNACVPTLSKLSQLRELNLQRTAVDEAALKTLRAKLPKCRIKH